MMRGLRCKRLCFKDQLSGFWGRRVSHFFFQMRSVWKLLNHHQQEQNCVKLWLVWQPNTVFLAWLDQANFELFDHSSFFLSHAFPISLNTLTFEPSLFQRFADRVPESSSVSPRGRHPRVLVEGFWHGCSSWEFSRTTSVPGCHTSGAQRIIVTRRPRLGACWEGSQRKTVNVIVI